jgi:hypothetical protein
LATPKLVGTEIAHAVPLTLVAGLGHASMGNLDLGLLGQLLIGSLPGIFIGSMLSGKFLIYFSECYCWNVILCRLQIGIYGLVIKVFILKRVFIDSAMKDPLYFL